MSTMRLTFHGAARTVTGSKYLLETDKHRVLVDCGIFQGTKQLRDINWAEPKFDPASLDAIVLTHAHIDHTGYLPVMAKRGFRGQVFCIGATMDLLPLLLLDSAHLQEEEARFANIHGTSKHKPAKPLYTEEDARNILRQTKQITRHQTAEILPGLSVSSVCAGHILGAVSLNFDCGGRRITFSGDIGRYDAPILPDPQPIAIGDLLLCESTYGDREHPAENVRDRLADVITRAAERGGPIIVPAFALGRTQDLLYIIGELERAGKIPALPVYVDSPMAVDATEIYRRYKRDYDEDAAEIVAAKLEPLKTKRTTFVHSSQDSRKLNHLRGSRIIISASGMATGGRILHHLKLWLPEESTTVVFVGFQAEGTRGRTILSGAPDVKIFGESVPIRAQVEELTGLSAHADRSELLRWLKSCSGTPAKVRVVHGESETADSFAGAIRQSLKWDAAPAEYLETVEV